MITFMNENGYLIDDYYKRKVVQRIELLKIDGAEGKDRYNIFNQLILYYVVVCLAVSILK